jgi:hypothetical protein
MYDGSAVDPIGREGHDALGGTLGELALAG